MAQKGLIQLNDLIKPINRADIQFALNELTSKSVLLTPIEKIELKFNNLVIDATGAYILV